MLFVFGMMFCEHRKTTTEHAVHVFVNGWWHEDHKCKKNTCTTHTVEVLSHCDATLLPMVLKLLRILKWLNHKISKVFRKSANQVSCKGVGYFSSITTWSKYMIVQRSNLKEEWPVAHWVECVPDVTKNLCHSSLGSTLIWTHLCKSWNCSAIAPQLNPFETYVSNWNLCFLHSPLSER